MDDVTNLCIIEQLKDNIYIIMQYGRHRKNAYVIHLVITVISFSGRQLYYIRLGFFKCKIW